MANLDGYKAYLGEFYVPPIKCPEVLKPITSFIRSNSSDDFRVGFKIASGLTQFRQVIQACILAHNKHIKFKVAEAYRDVAEIYTRTIAKDPSLESFGIFDDLSKPDLLVIYKPLSNTIALNRQMPNICLSLSETRMFSGKKTVFLFFQVEPLFYEFFPVIDLVALSTGATLEQATSLPSNYSGTTARANKASEDRQSFYRKPVPTGTITNNHPAPTTPSSSNSFDAPL